MADFDQTDDIDALIDKAVDTFFVEAPSEDELAFEEDEGASSQAPPAPPPPPQPQPQVQAAPPPREPVVDTYGEEPEGGPSLEEAVDSLFMEAFDAGEELDETPAQQDESPARAFAQTPTVVTSGDEETDRAIDLAVDTLFIEEPEIDAVPPETARLEVTEVKPGIPSEEPIHDVVTPAEQQVAPPPAPPKPAPSPTPAPPPQPSPPPPPVRPAADTAPEGGGMYDNVMAMEIERHMDTMFETQAPAPAAVEPPPTTPKEVERPPEPAAPPKVSPLRRLQEAILTLEWEISKRSIKSLAQELQKVRAQYQNNVTVDFAAMSMNGGRG